MESWTWLISLVGSAGAVLAASAAWLSARATHRSAEETQKAIFAEIATNVLDAYSSPKMLSSKRELRQWQKEHGEEFAKKFAELRPERTDKINRIDRCRRRVSHHYYKIWRLYDGNIIDEEFVKVLMTPGQLDFLIEVNEPMERAINPDYNKEMFDTLCEIFDKER